MQNNKEQPPKKKPQEIDSARLKPEIAREFSYSEELRKKLIEKGVYDKDYFENMGFDFTEYKNTKKRIEDTEKMLKEGSFGEDVDPEEIEELKKELEKDKTNLGGLEDRFFEKKEDKDQSGMTQKDVADKENLENKPPEVVGEKKDIPEKNSSVDLEIANLEKQIKEFDKEMLDRDITKIKQSEADALSKKWGDMRRKLEELKEIKEGKKKNKEKQTDPEKEGEEKDAEKNISTNSIGEGNKNVEKPKTELNEIEEKITETRSKLVNGVLDGINKDEREKLTNEMVDLIEKEAKLKVGPPIIIHTEPQMDIQEQQTNQVIEQPRANSGMNAQEINIPINRTASPETSSEGEMRERRRRNLEEAKQTVPQGEVRELIFKIISKDMGAKEVPPDFVLPDNYQEVNDMATLFLADKKKFEEKCKEMKGVRTEMEKNEARIWRDNYELALGKSIDRLKLSLHDKFVKEKGEMLKNTGNFSDEEIKAMLKQELLQYDAGVIFRMAVPLEGEITKMKVESELSEKDISRWQKLRKAYGDLPQWKRMGISVALSAGIGAGIVFAGTGAIAAAATVGVVRAGRTFAGGSVSAGLRYISEKVIGKKYDKKREAEMKAGEQETYRRLETQVSTWEKENQEWMESEEKKLKLMGIVDGSAKDTNKKLDEVASKENKAKRKATIISGLVGGTSVLAASIDWHTLLAGGPVSGVGGAGKNMIPDHAPSNIPGTHIEDFATAHKGDSVWRLIEEDATKNVKGFSSLNEAQRTYFIDHLKDQVAADPHKFGLENADQIKLGYGKELSSLFENNQDIQGTLESAKNLTKGQMDSIMQSNASQRAALLESMKPKVSQEVLGEKPIVLNEVVVTPEEHVEKFVTKGVDAYGVETVKELPIELKGNKELAQAYLNYKGNPNFVEGSQPQDWAKASGAEELVKLTDQHPEYLKVGAVREALREIHTNNLIDELHEGGAFKFLNSADHADLLKETTGLAKTYGLDTYRAQSFSDFLSQGNEMNEETFTAFTDPDTGAFLSDRFQEAIQHFHSLETMTDLPKIPDGSTASLWEPRLISVNGADPIVGLVKQTSPDMFEYKTPTGLVGDNILKDAMDKMIVRPPSK